MSLRPHKGERIPIRDGVQVGERLFPLPLRDGWGGSFTNSLPAASPDTARYVGSGDFCKILVSGEKAPEVRKTTDGGVNPRYRSINETKALKGRQNI